jgi:hypothetical protein
VSAPQKPVTINNRLAGEMETDASTSPAIPPIIRQPVKLTSSVPAGKAMETGSKASAIRYRLMAPTKPPKPTKRIEFIVFMVIINTFYRYKPLIKIALFFYLVKYFFFEFLICSFLLTGKLILIHKTLSLNLL